MKDIRFMKEFMKDVDSNLLIFIYISFINNEGIYDINNDN